MFAPKLDDCKTLLSQFKASQESNIIYLHLFELFLGQVTRNELIHKFVSYFPDDDEAQQTNKSTCNKSKPHGSFLDAVEFLAEYCQLIEQTANKLGGLDDLKKEFFHEVKRGIINQKPHHLSQYLISTYSQAFKAFLTLDRVSNQQSTSRKSFADSSFVDNDDAAQRQAENEENSFFDEDDEATDGDTCLGCDLDRDNCGCDNLCRRFDKVNSFLRDAGLLDGLVGGNVMEVCRIFIVRRVAAKGKSNYAFSYLDDLSIWVHGVVKRWIANVNGYSSIKDSDKVDNIGELLDKHLNEAYAEERKSHLFEIIIEYPNSEPAIQDLKMCLEQSTSPDFRKDLIESSKKSLSESLLHPGVNTSDILTAYISAIKALRALDPTGLILEFVTEPVRKYLKSRDDTVRFIVTALTDEENNSELNREMMRTVTKTNESGESFGKGGANEMSLPNEGEKCTATNFERWKPDPIELKPTDDNKKSSRFSDIVSILVNIYETKDRFVEEYQNLLSQRLLSKYDDCNLDIELRNLELLTVRFSDCELHRCEVMLKDVQTSKRINKRIATGDIRNHKLDEFKNLDVLIVSSPFWPEKFGPIATVTDESPELTFPPEIDEAINTYTKAFEAIQASRTLHWRHHLGSVNMDVTINGTSTNFSVTPMHASILMLFKDKKSWKLADLMRATSLPAATLRSRLAYWQRNGIIKESVEEKYDLIVDN